MPRLFRSWLLLALAPTVGTAGCDRSTGGQDSAESAGTDSTSGTADGASSAPTSGITDGGSSSGTTGEPGSNPNASDGQQDLPEGDNCCEAHQGPGCNEPEVVQCVCAVDVACCGFDWTPSCVAVAQGACEATCTAAVTGADSDGSSSGVSAGGSTGDFETGDVTTGAVSDSNCCSVQDFAGCDDPVVEDCTCELDSFCCDDQWDSFCIEQAVESCSLVCP